LRRIQKKSQSGVLNAASMLRPSDRLP
jgi:hypothetical protein